MDNEPRHLFVYGTLMRRSKSPYAKLLRLRADFAGEAFVTGRLYYLGTYPAAVTDETAITKVFGELYAIKAHQIFEALDRYEGCHQSDPPPHLFQRVIVRARLIGGDALPAWTYLFRGKTAGRPLIGLGKFRLRS